eukprot:5824131-Amphidinium_carterae.2
MFEIHMRKTQLVPSDNIMARHCAPLAQSSSSWWMPVRSMMGKALTTQGKTSFHSNAFFKVANHYEIGFCSKLLMMKARYIQ